MSPTVLFVNVAPLSSIKGRCDPSAARKSSLIIRLAAASETQQSVTAAKIYWITRRRDDGRVMRQVMSRSVALFRSRSGFCFWFLCFFLFFCFLFLFVFLV